MKNALLLSGLLLVLSATPIFAATPTPAPTPVGQVKGLYDTLEYSDVATYSASKSATPKPTTSTRTASRSAAKTPVSGAVENTIALLLGGTAFLLLGLKFSKS